MKSFSKKDLKYANKKIECPTKRGIRAIEWLWWSSLKYRKELEKILDEYEEEYGALPEKNEVSVLFSNIE